MDRRRFFSTAGLAAAALARPAQAAAVGEKFSRTVCEWTPENPRHDHQQIFELSDDRLLLVWCEYYVKKPSRIRRTPYSTDGSSDAAPCRISGRISADRGRSWSGKITLQDNFGADNVKHPNLLRLPSGEILFSFTVRDFGKQTLEIYLKRSKDEGETWTDPVRISPPGGVWFTNADHNFLHSSGRIILPCHQGEFYGSGDHYNAFCLYSDDQGATWQPSSKRVDLPKRGAEEPGMVELEDGSILSMMRTTLGKVYRSVSKDRGETWAEATPTELPSPSSANCIKRIPQTGDLVFLWNNATPEALTGGTRYHYPRNPLTAGISSDEGATWKHIKDIERREGYISGYPSISILGEEAFVTFYHSSRSMSRDSWLELRIFDVDWFYA